MGLFSKRESPSSIGPGPNPRTSPKSQFLRDGVRRAEPGHGRSRCLPPASPPPGSCPLERRRHRHHLLLRRPTGRFSAPVWSHREAAGVGPGFHRGDLQELRSSYLRCDGCLCCVFFILKMKRFDFYPFLLPLLAIMLGV